MNDLVDWQKARGRRTSSREVATIKKIEVEKLPPGFQEALEALDKRVMALEEKPDPLIPSNANEPVIIPRGVTDLVERVSQLEKLLSDSGVTHDDLDALAKVVNDIGGAALATAEHHAKRLSALEAGVANLPSDLLIEVQRAQVELNNRRV